MPFSVLKKLPTKNVAVRRRDETPGYIRAGTPFIVTSNRTPEQVFGPVNSKLLRGCMHTVCLDNTDC